jgi:hypothetical protein
MFSLKSRLKILTKIAQQTGAAAVSQPSTSTTSTTTATVPTPPAFNAASGPWAWIVRAYNPPTVQYLSFLLRMIHVALHYASNGQHNLVKDQNDIGSVDPSGMASVDAKNLVLLAQLFYRTFLNNGNALPQAPSPAHIGNWASTIANSQPLLNLSQLNPTGPTAQQLGLDGSFRQNMVNYLTYIRQYNPAQQQQQR